MAKWRKLFFDLIEIPVTELAQQTIYIDRIGDDPVDPEQYVAVLYPKWRIIKRQRFLVDEPGETEWKLILQEDPEKKTYQYINPYDRKVYQRTVVESAPDVDLERLRDENPLVYQSITFQPDPPPRELKSLDDLTDDQKDILKQYLLPVKLTNRMEAPRNAKPEELEGLE